MRSLPLDVKILKTQQRIREWVNFYGLDGVYVSFSGGKDSTVLLHIARQLYPSIEAVFVDTGLEYPAIRKFVKSFEHVTIIRPKMRFDEVIKKYGYPLISKEVSECVSQGKIALKSNKYVYRLQKLLGTAVDKQGRKSLFNKEKYAPLLYVDFNVSHMCCNVMKKKPAHEYGKLTGRHPITGQTTEESRLREQQWLKNGCNGFNMKSPISNPMSFWTEQDVLRYIKENNVALSSIYGEIREREKERESCTRAAFTEADVSFVYLVLIAKMMTALLNLNILTQNNMHIAWAVASTMKTICGNPIRMGLGCNT